MEMFIEKFIQVKIRGFSEAQVYATVCGETGLAYYRSLDSNGETWCVTHMASGKIVPGCGWLYCNEVQVQRIITALAKLGDWRCSESEIASGAIENVSVEQLIDEAMKG